ncbi:Cytochrome c, mono-and diheme variants [Aquiflexum balticum DSM 16537]|uniref:Cytochrome c, mono-and diheme variants n=1 Tax=Aquiflexum balticum DSM 16537 TaxID=758820 RepID=A0A1W2H462_9BACT|nr:c-type cytochrome [Aquiflexum balticum]SMD43564.1 Cytochrome c, mono-and diheme variants [Aquiflexum balticum DSM 16537]
MTIKRSLLSVPLRLSTWLLVFLLSMGTQAFAVNPDVSDSEEAIAAGKSIFNANCRTCHRLDQKNIGPALRGVSDRHSIEWNKSFIRNSQALIASGDPEAVAIYNEFNQLAMPSHEFLSDEDVMNLLSYIEYGDKADPAAAAATGGEGGQVGVDGGIPSEYLTIILSVLVVVLLLILVVLGLIISILTKYLSNQNLDEVDAEYVNQKFDFKKILRSDAFVIIITTLVVAFVAKSGIDQLYTIGVQQGYAPAQPIAFSHQLHAGQYEMECQYCHTGVEIGKSANIPSANICMNCHAHIQNVGGKEGISPEIQKIYNAVDNNQPIEWVRIHNLPDLAYFNHSQHVAVGGLECQTCHGPIEEMEVVYQHSSLTMGWCIDCHRQTEIKSQGNEYYDKLVQLHSESKNALKVKDIGGLECAKCHY